MIIRAYDFTICGQLLCNAERTHIHDEINGKTLLNETVSDQFQLDEIERKNKLNGEGLLRATMLQIINFWLQHSHICLIISVPIARPSDNDAPVTMRILLLNFVTVEKNAFFCTTHTHPIACIREPFSHQLQWIGLDTKHFVITHRKVEQFLLPQRKQRRNLKR